MRSQMWLYSEPSEPLSTKPIIFQRNYSFYHYAAYRSKLNFLFLFSYVVTFFCHRRCSALGLFGVRASFTVNNGFLHKERIQVLPIKWWRYIIALINHGYYEPAGAQCHKTGWKTGSLDFPFLWPGWTIQLPSPPLISFQQPQWNGCIFMLWHFCLAITHLLQVSVGLPIFTNTWEDFLLLASMLNIVIF